MFLVAVSPAIQPRPPSQGSFTECAPNEWVTSSWSPVQNLGPSRAEALPHPGRRQVPEPHCGDCPCHVLTDVPCEAYLLATPGPTRSAPAAAPVMYSRDKMHFCHLQLRDLLVHPRSHAFWMTHDGGTCLEIHQEV